MGWFKKNKSSKKSGPPESRPSKAEPGPSNDREPEAGPTEPTGRDGLESSQPAEPTALEPPASKPSRGIFQRLRSGLAKTRRLLTSDLDSLFAVRKAVDKNLLEDLEELLISCDIGVQTVMEIIDRISGKAASIRDAAELKEALKSEILALMSGQTPAPVPIESRPHIVMVVGVNGVGKTTTIGKMAARYAAGNQTVLIAAADTFRAAAIEQLSIWADRAGAEFVRHKHGADPAAVAFDAVTAAKARKLDMVLIDTAGRLHTKVNLMEELKKIQRTIAKVDPEAPHEVLLVLDATTGQNAVSQARMFHEALGVSGIALTKLDGTAKGGIVVSIANDLNIPLQYVGVGESIEDLQPFDPQRFVEALF
jgi:fused signal recognition particle receptor